MGNQGKCVFFFFFVIAERARVGLAPLPGMKGTDYINASYIMVRVNSYLYVKSNTLNGAKEQTPPMWLLKYFLNV